MSPLRIFFPALVFVGGIVLMSGILTPTAPLSYDRGTPPPGLASSTEAVLTVPTFVVTHITPPATVKAAYMTSCIASGKRLRAPLVKLVEDTELNALVIDIKDYTGTLSFDTKDERFPLDKKGCSVPDMKEFIGELHEKGIYVIGRVTVMQDASYPKLHPDAAVKKKSDGSIWKDKKGITFVDPGAKEYWEYMVDLGRISYAMGFDEINYDYIRFPSDGNMSDIAFLRTGSTTKAEQMRRFYAYLGGELRKEKIPTSADLFGMTTTNTDDLGIGQVLENGLAAFDFIAPMVYPSHYPPNFNGWKNPNDVPGPVVGFSMKRAVVRANAMEKKESSCGATRPKTATSTAATSTDPCLAWKPTGLYAHKLRPWLQDFDYGGDYDAADVRAQIEATYDAGLNSFMMWDPSNKYTPIAYHVE